MTACTKEDEVPLIVVESGNDSISYNLIPCTIEDVILTTSLRCTYKKNAEQEVYFPVSGKLVDKVYVKAGDVVHKGDVLAELSTGTLEAEIRDLEYKIRKNELLLTYVNDNQLIDIQYIYLENLYGKFVGMDDFVKDQVDGRINSDKYRIQSYEDALEFDRKKLAQKKAELAQSRIYATMDGTVYSVADHLEGSTSNVEKVAMTIVDNSEGYFETEAADMMDYITEDTVLTMSIVYGGGKGEYEIVPLDMESWDDFQKFAILSGGDPGAIEAGTNGTITIVIEARENVLALPSNCVYQADSDYYVYILNDENIREVRWVKVGLCGDDKTEILEGLEVGEKVVKR